MSWGGRAMSRASEENEFSAITADVYVDNVE